MPVAPWHCRNWPVINGSSEVLARFGI